MSNLTTTWNYGKNDEKYQKYDNYVTVIDTQGTQCLLLQIYLPTRVSIIEQKVT